MGKYINTRTEEAELTPFKRCCLENFPFIEADFDALTNYELYCKIVEYLNKVIDQTNVNTADVAYIKNYFANLDVQEEINNKLDQMAADGTFDDILIKYLKLSRINVLYFGVVNDGITDNYTAIQNIIDSNPNKTLFFPAGNYLISNTIKIYSGNKYQVNIIFDNNAKIFTNDTLDSLIEIGSLKGEYSRYSVGNISTIKGGIFDATKCNTAIKIIADRKQTRLLDNNIINVKKYGIFIDRNKGISSISSDTLINNLSITGTKNYADNNIGIYIFGTDNEFNNIRITGIKECIRIDGGGNLFNNLHLTAAYENVTSEMINNSIGVSITGFGNNYFNNCYIDTYGKSFVLNKENTKNYFTNVQTFYYLVDSNSNYKVFNYYKRCYCKVINSYFEMGNDGTQQVVYLDSSLEYNTRKYPTTKKIIKFTNCDAINLTSEYDLYLETSINNDFKNYTLNKNPWSVNMIQNEWYKLMILNDGVHSLRIQMANDQVSDVLIRVKKGSNTITAKDVYHSASHVKKYEISLGNEYTDNTDNYFCYLFIRALDRDSSLNPSVTMISENWTNQNIICTSITPTQNPTIVTSANLQP